MKAFLRNLLAATVLALGVQTVSQAQSPVVLSGDITTNTSLSNTNIYLLQGFVYVKSGATLTIPAGTLIKGDRASKGTLIIEKGGRIQAQGTATQPIVFTSNQAPGLRSYGDWGGIVICGNATQNQPGSPVIEGGVGATYGGNDDTDNSGVLSYVRIEFAGIPLTPGNEINGLTMGGVGSGTQIDHVQVSYCGDDSFEWFGGTVNAKYLVALGTWDDDFDTDFGYRGNVQFALSLRDPKVADQSRSNFFEADNDATGSDNTPFSAPVFSNVTALVSPGPDTLHRLHGRGLHLRRNTRLSLFNSLVAGMNTGLLLDGTKCENNAQNGLLELNNNILHARRNSGLFQVAANSTFLNTLVSWFNTGRGNDTSSITPIASAAALLGVSTDIVRLTNPDLSIASTSPLATGASFTNSKLSNNFFTPTTYRGAIDPANPTAWLAGWTNFNPQLTDYSSPLSVSNQLTTAPIVVYPNPAADKVAINLVVDNAQDATVSVVDLTGKTVLTKTAQLEAGNNTINLQTADLSAGVYNVRFANGNKQSVQRLVIVR